MKGTVRQRNPGSWEIKVFLGRDANGKRIRKTETVRGKKADAERQLREILSEVDRGITPAKTLYKVGEWLDKWLEEKKARGRRAKTVDRYEGIILLHLKPKFWDRASGKIVPYADQRIGLGADQGRYGSQRCRVGPRRSDGDYGPSSERSGTTWIWTTLVCR